jgi:hypothetical protein
MTSVYDSERLAACYAFDRPPVHEQILRSARLTGGPAGRWTWAAARACPPLPWRPWPGR